MIPERSRRFSQRFGAVNAPRSQICFKSFRRPFFVFAEKQFVANGLKWILTKSGGVGIEFCGVNNRLKFGVRPSATLK